MFHNLHLDSDLEYLMLLNDMIGIFICVFTFPLECRVDTYYNPMFFFCEKNGVVNLRQFLVLAFPLAS